MQPNHDSSSVLQAVGLGDAPASPGTASSIAVAAVDGVEAALASGVLWGSELETPGEGRTQELWELLATVGAHDLQAVRAIEPHLDAVAILRQAGPAALPATFTGPGCTWGVFAAEGPDPLVAEHREGTWVLDGVKPWCSLADRLHAALVTAVTPSGERGVFAVDLAGPGVTVEPTGWHARGLSDIPSGPVRFRDVPAYAVGPPGWYLQRPGFEWGGIGVAACWFGGLVGLGRSVREAARAHPERDITAMHLGAIDSAVWTCSILLADAAQRIDAGRATGEEGRLLAKRVRGVIADACEEVIIRTGHALGPAPLALDAQHAQRVADLQLYIRQHHAEADLASLGRASAASSSW